MNKAQQDYLAELRQIHERRLQELEKQAATRGIDTPPQIRTEIEDIKGALSHLDTQKSGRVKPAGLAAPAKSSSNPSWLLYLLAILTLVIGVLLGRSITGGSAQPATGSPTVISTDYGRQTAIAELQPTMTSLQETSAAALTRSTPSIITGTETVEPTPSVNSSSVSLADLHFKVESFESSRLPRGSNHLTVEAIGDRNSISDIYKLDFTIPISPTDSNKELQTGFKIHLFEAQNISQYKSLTFTMSFSDDKAICGMFIESNENKYKYIPLGEGTYTYAGSGEHLVTIPVKEILPEIPSGLVYNITVYSSTWMTNGSHSIKIRDIRFEK